MLTHNFHTHTMRCRHASGTDRDYIESAIRGGIRVLGFSDHAPYVFEGDYYSTFRMYPGEIEEYVSALLKLKDEYKKEIEIHIGLEAEYYPAFFEAFLRLIEPYPVEYLILGQHALKNEMDGGIYSARRTTDEAVLFEYVNQVKAGIETGAFSYVAHPDVLNFRENDESEEKAWRELCLCAKKHNVPVEINLLGIRDKRYYPYMTFWKIAGETGVSVVTGVDAHRPEDVADNASFETAQLLIKKYGLNYIGMPALIAPCRRK